MAMGRRSFPWRVHQESAADDKSMDDCRWRRVVVGNNSSGEICNGDRTLALSLTQFNALVDCHSPALYRIAYRMMGDRHEAEDMVQETFRSAWKSREAFREGVGDRAWLASILRRRIVDRWRRRTPPPTLGHDTPLDVGVPAADPLAGDYTDEMQFALARLPTDLRETLLLVVVGELTHQEVANLLDVPLGTVLSRVSRARRRLREVLIAART